jgi:lipopolysaccharide export system permease protein
MSTVSRYVLRQLVVMTTLVTLTLTCAIWLTQSLRFVELIVNRGLSIGTFLYLTLLLLPSFLWLMLPIAVFVSVLFIYNRLATDSELVVMRGAGLGPLALARPAIVVALGATAIAYSLALYFLPVSYREFKDLEFDVRNDYAGLLLREGAFTTVASGITVYVRAREPSGDLVGIMVHDNRKPQEPVTMIAERGRLAISGDGPRVVLVAGSRQQFDAASGHLQVLHFERYSVDLGRVAQRGGERWREPRERFLHELFGRPRDQHDRLYRARLLAEGHNRVVAPLLATALTLVALACLLSGDFNRRGQGRRALAAIVIGVALLSGSVAAHNAITKWRALAPLAYAIVVVPSLVSLWWLLRRPGRRRVAPAAAPLPA